MAANDDIRVARAFHDETTHTPWSVRTSGHALDWDVKPLPFKVYADLPARPLPREFVLPAIDTLRALAGGAPAAGRLDEPALAALLYFTAGVTRRKTYPGGTEVLFRAAPSTGALYQTEVYVAAGAVDGLAPGLYHFNPGDFALRAVRTGDVRAALATAAAEPAVARRAATLVLTAIYWRNTWKYRTRGWRHLYWDAGTMLANLTATAGALGLAPWVLTGFADEAVNRLLGVDIEREAALVLVVLGPEGTEAPSAPAPPPVAHAVVPLSSREVQYPAVVAMQRASALDDPEAVQLWRGRPAPPALRPPAGAAPEAPRIPPAPASVPAAPGDRLSLPPPRTTCGRPLHDTIQHRGSSRRFRPEPLTAEEEATVLWWATRPVDADVPGGLVTPFVIVHAVEGVEPGAWRYRPAEHALELVRLGRFRNESAYLCLEQALGGDAALVLYFLAPLDALLAVWGNRGYRLANLEAGLGGGRAYLAAYGQHFGATGLTFYDRKVVEFFAPASAGLDAVFVTALGRGARVPW